MQRLGKRAVAVGLISTIAATAPAFAAGRTKRVNLGPHGVQSNGEFGFNGPAISAGGRFVAFDSDASNLIPGGTNGKENVFVRDRQEARTELVSVGPGGARGNGNSGHPAISPDGRFVVFESEASNLVPHDTNGQQDVFLRDREAGKTELVSVGQRGNLGNDLSFAGGVSLDGRFVAFSSRASNLVPGDTNGFDDVFIRDRKTGTTERASIGPRGVQGNESSNRAAISANGRFVLFASAASNLVRNDINGMFFDVFVLDRKTRKLELVSVGAGGIEGNDQSYVAAISPDGRFVAFQSFASNLVPGDTNGFPDVFLRDRKACTTRRVSVGPGGVQGDSYSGNDGVALSADARFVAFESFADNLVSGDTNGEREVFLRDRKLGTIERVSLGPGGVQGNGDSGRFGVAISADGHVVAFLSYASNLVPHDTNSAPDVFVRIR